MATFSTLCNGWTPATSRRPANGWGFATVMAMVVIMVIVITVKVMVVVMAMAPPAPTDTLPQAIPGPLLNERPPA